MIPIKNEKLGSEWLKFIKQAAEEAEPFREDENAADIIFTQTEENQLRIRRNSHLFLVAVENIPMLVDEIIFLREYIEMLKNSEEVFAVKADKIIFQGNDDDE